MRKAFELLMAGGLIAVSNASPFVGEHADKNSIDHGDGRVSMRMKPVKTSMNKYDSLMYRGKLFTDKKTPLE